MTKFFIAVIAGVIIIAVTTYPRQKVNSSDNILNRQVKGASLESVSTGQAALNTLISAKVPGGIATLQDCNGWQPYTFKPTDTSLRAILDSIVSTDPQYTWDIKDDVINFVPRNGEPSFLTVRVPELEINQAETTNDALFQLLAVPEVRQAQLNLGRFAVQGGGIYPFCPQGCSPKRTKKLSLSLKGVTVREALNAIAHEHGSAVWWFNQAQCGESKTFTINFATNE